MFGLNMFQDAVRWFNCQYRCYPICMMPGNERHDVEKGGKIILPPSALEQLTRLNVVYPMLFKLTNPNTDRSTHCGVLEFVADEGRMYIPFWMMRNLLAEEGNLIQVETAILPVAKYSKFQPQTPDFLDIHDPKAVLENALRSFACLTTGDVITIYYNTRQYEMCVLETKPGPAVTIIECDMNVEFATPIGYKEQEPPPPQTSSVEEEMPVDSEEAIPPDMGFVPFSGGGVRLDGKRAKDDGMNNKNNLKGMARRGIPDYDYKPGILRFIRTPKTNNEENEPKEENDDFKAFRGEGNKLRSTRR